MKIESEDVINDKIQKILGPDAYFRDGKWRQKCCDKEIEIEGKYDNDNNFCFWMYCPICGTDWDWER